MSDYTFILAFPPALILGFLVSLGIALQIIKRFADEHMTEKRELQLRVWDLEASLRNIRWEAIAALKETGDD